MVANLKGCKSTLHGYQWFAICTTLIVIRKTIKNSFYNMFVLWCTCRLKFSICVPLPHVNNNLNGFLTHVHMSIEAYHERSLCIILLFRLDVSVGFQGIVFLLSLYLQYGNLIAFIEKTSLDRWRILKLDHRKTRNCL